jgi:uncharacterized protein
MYVNKKLYDGVKQPDREGRMERIDRRAILGGAALAGVAAAQVSAAPAVIALADIRKEAEIACAYHCDFGDAARFAQMLQNIANHYSVYGNPLDLQIVIVAHGQGVKFFLEDLEGSPWKDDAAGLQLFQRVSDLAKSGLAVLMCNITFERLKLDRDKLRKADFIRFTPSGVATVAALQTKGFAYIKTG